ncbi:MAG: hypothetical protein N4A41_09760 [Crocinitomicaceae bacterium]|jgi:hypothetical protein|nr:hypothetical protein [Crocinitomicaceae bacterium]
MKRIIKKILLWGSGIFLLLVVVLFVHIWMVTGNKKQDQRKRQLARIDILQPVDSLQVSTLRNCISAQEGVRTTLYTANENALIYEFDPTNQSSDKVLEKASSETGLALKKFMISKEQSMEGCPVMDKSSFSYRLGKFFENVIN